MLLSVNLRLSSDHVKSLIDSLRTKGFSNIHGANVHELN